MRPTRRLPGSRENRTYSFNPMMEKIMLKVAFATVALMFAATAYAAPDVVKAVADCCCPGCPCGH